MKQILFINNVRVIFIFTLLTTFVHGQAARKSTPPPWYSLDSQDGGFSIKFPQKPQFTSTPMAGGALIANSYSLQIGPSYYFLVAFYDFPGIDEQRLKGEFDLM